MLWKKAGSGESYDHSSASEAMTCEISSSIASSNLVWQDESVKERGIPLYHLEQSEREHILGVLAKLEELQKWEDERERWVFWKKDI